MMRQFFDLKRKHPDAIMLFRCGDFYETYAEDAEEAASLLGITLTRRANGQQSYIAMAGFPHHALDTYLPKLVRAGKRVAICDQLEDPKTTKKLVKRGITELVTPGVAMNDRVLSAKENNFLAAVTFLQDRAGVAFLDISTGEFMVSEGAIEHIDKLLDNFSPKEVVCQKGKREYFETCFGNKMYLYPLDDWMFSADQARNRLMKHFETHSLKGFGVEQLNLAVTAAGVILQYLDLTQHDKAGHITHIRRVDTEEFVRIDRFTLRSLELVDSMNDDGHSLLSIIDKTLCPMGARLLRRWILFPLKDVGRINNRLDGVESIVHDETLIGVLDENLPLIGDLERLISKAAVGRIQPREVAQLKSSLQALEPIKVECMQSDNHTISRIGEQLDLCESIRRRIERELVPEPPLAIGKGKVIADGVSAELDNLRKIAHSGKDFLLQIQQRESQQTGIPSLKIAYNNVYGYYIEVRHTHRDKVPAEWIRKQTLTNAERYVTPELKEYEEQILGAEDKISIIETQLFNELVSALSVHIASLQANANLLARLDCLQSLATVANANHYVRPELSDDCVLDIKQGRHPVIEQQLPMGEQYVANDVYLDDKTQQIVIVTGPNMAGKSALLRQTALITLMAQIGSFVPARSAHVGVIDKLFTRVGASDNISMGESTFMVEMNEASNILNNLSGRSLVIFDELGRGTSTYDGISIAWAIVEYIHEHPNGKARTLFATHYHELNEMESRFGRIKNYNVSVKEQNQKIIFLRKLERGGSEHSFGIHVAKMAGMPRSIVDRADEILHLLENQHHSNAESAITAPTDTISADPSMQLSFFQLDDPVLCQIRDEILTTDINRLTPIEALNKLNDIKKILTGK